MISKENFLQCVVLPTAVVWGRNDQSGAMDGARWEKINHAASPCVVTARPTYTIYICPPCALHCGDFCKHFIFVICFIILNQRNPWRFGCILNTSNTTVKCLPRESFFVLLAFWPRKAAVSFPLKPFYDSGYN